MHNSDKQIFSSSPVWRYESGNRHIVRSIPEKEIKGAASDRWIVNLPNGKYFMLHAGEAYMLSSNPPTEGRVQLLNREFATLTEK